MTRRPLASARRPWRRMRRVATVLTCLALVFASTPAARADDDPQPVEWPQIEAPSTDSKSDPTPVDWPRPQQA